MRDEYVNSETERVCYCKDFAEGTSELSDMSRADPWGWSLLSEAAEGGGVRVAQIDGHSAPLVLEVMVTSLLCLLSLCCFPVHRSQDQT